MCKINGGQGPVANVVVGLTYAADFGVLIVALVTTARREFKLKRQRRAQFEAQLKAIESAESAATQR
jgi:hypothetical protein